MAKVVVTATQDWRKIAEMAGGNPDLIMFDPATSELEVDDVTQPALDTAHAAYVADQANIDAATAQEITVADRGLAEDLPDSPLQDGMSSRSIIEIFNKRDNFLTTRIIELQDAMAAMKASAGTVQNLRDAIPATFLPTQTRPRNDAIQDYKDEISSGNADN